MLGRGITGAVALVAVGLVAALTGCATTPGVAAVVTAPVSKGSTIVLGAHAPLSGPLGPQWTRITNATKAWFDYVNDNGGVGGHRIEYRVVDDRADSKVALKAVERLVEKDRVFAMVGDAGSDTHRAAASYLAAHSVPDLFISSGVREWDDVKAAPMRFSFAPDSTIEAKVLATTLDRQFNGQAEVNGKVVSTQYCSVVENSGRGDAIVAGLKAVLGKGLVQQQRFDSTATDLHAQVAALQSAGCQVNVVGGADVQTAAALSAAKDLGYSAKWATPSLGGGLQSISDALGNSTEYVEGLLSTTALPIAGDDAWVKLFNDVNSQYGDHLAVDSDAVYGMSLGYAAVEALSRASDGLDRASLVKAMEGGRVAGPGLLPLAYSTLSHASYQGVAVTQVQNGIPVILEHQIMLGSATGPRVVEYLGSPIKLTGNGLPAS